MNASAPEQCILGNSFNHERILQFCSEIFKDATFYVDCCLHSSLINYVKFYMSIPLTTVSHKMCLDPTISSDVTVTSFDFKKRYLTSRATLSETDAPLVNRTLIFNISVSVSTGQRCMGVRCCNWKIYQNHHCAQCLGIENWKT